MNTNIVFSADGYKDGVLVILDGFQAMIEDAWQADVLGTLVAILGAIIAAVGVWYGTRAIIRAMRTPK